MRTHLCIILLACVFNGLGQTLTKIWETDSVFKKPESVIYDKANHVIYVSNINGKYCAKDGNGFISKLSLNGKVEELEWVNGLDSPQGMGIYNNHLYVADVNQVVVINIEERCIERVFKIDSAIFLNDITADRDGAIYISDCRGNKIYRLKNNHMTIWLDNPLLYGPNGLLCTDDRIFILNMGNSIVYTVDKQTKLFTLFSEGLKNCDGIVSDGNIGYFISGAWQGELYHLSSKGDQTLLLNLGMDPLVYHKNNNTFFEKIDR